MSQVVVAPDVAVWQVGVVGVGDRTVGDAGVEEVIITVAVTLLMLVGRPTAQNHLHGKWRQQDTQDNFGQHCSMLNLKSCQLLLLRSLNKHVR